MSKQKNNCTARVEAPGGHEATNPTSMPNHRAKASACAPVMQAGAAYDQCFSLTPDAEVKARQYLNEPESSQKSLISPVEYIALLRALERGQGCFTEAEANKIEEWAERVRWDYCFLEFSLQGIMNARFDPDGELAFSLAKPKAGHEGAPDSAERPKAS